MQGRDSAKSVAEEYAHRVWDDKDLKAIDDLVNDAAVIHSLLGDFRGPAPMKTVVQAWLKGFPDLNVRNDLVICENDLVCIQSRLCTKFRAIPLPRPLPLPNRDP